jgi:ATP-binding cassette subfamily F protein 3
MIYADKINLSFGSQPIFEDLSFSIQQDQKVGLVGRNGSGKSTLLRAIVDNDVLDGGALTFFSGKKIAYLPQNVVLASERSIIDETIRAIEEVARLLDKSELLQKQMATDHSNETAQEYANVQAALAEYNIEYLQAQAKRILHGLGFKTEQFNMPVSTLSVGWKMRVVLAKLLLQDADFYLFDEPTNHLDLIAKEWFLSFLKNASFGFMLVCHERYFMDELCTHILSLERGKGHMYTGNYSKFVAQKKHDDELLRAAYVNQQKDIKQRKETIERFRAKASKAKMAQSMIKALEKIEIIELPHTQKTMSFNFQAIKPSGRIVVEARNLGYAFDGKTIFENVSFIIERGQKVAIVAANGVGKTTLLNVINKKLPLQKGTVTFDMQATCALFEQDQNKMLDQNATIVQNITELCPKKSEQAIRTMLGAFLFSGDDVNKKVSVLSGGEKNRVGMVATLLHDANLLMLDEPTNHLDIESKETLLKALQSYTGTMIFVSHDRDFINDLATHILELTPTGAFFYHGNFDSYVYQKQHNGQMPEPKKEKAVVVEEKISTSTKSNKELYLLRKESNRLERMVSKAEEKIAELTKKSTESTWGSAESAAIQQELEALKEKHAALTAEWEKIELQCNE